MLFHWCTERYGFIMLFYSSNLLPVEMISWFSALVLTALLGYCSVKFANFRKLLFVLWLYSQQDHFFFERWAKACNYIQSYILHVCRTHSDWKIHPEHFKSQNFVGQNNKCVRFLRTFGENTSVIWLLLFDNGDQGNWIHIYWILGLSFRPWKLHN